MTTTIHPVREQTIMDQKSAVIDRRKPKPPVAGLRPIHIDVTRIECPKCESLLSPAGVVTLDEYDDADYGGRIQVIATYCPLCDKLVEFYLLAWGSGGGPKRSEPTVKQSSFTTVFSRVYEGQERIDRFLERYPEARAVMEL